MAAADDSFGPFFEVPGRHTFDFTLLFEDTILSILPSSLLLLTVPIRIAQLLHASRKVRSSHLRLAKMILLVTFTALQIANIVVWSLHPGIRTRASLAAAILSLAVAIGLCALSDVEHQRCVRPSFVINAYLLLTVPMDAAKVRTLWLRSVSPSPAAMASGSLALKVLVLVVEAVEKRRILLSPHSRQPPEATSGLYTRGLFWWLNPMLILGYKSVLNEDDVFCTDDSLTAKLLHEKFQRGWVRRSKTTRRHQLITIIARCMLRPLAMGVLPRVWQTFFRYMQPLLIKRATRLIDQPISKFTTNQGWGLVAAYGLVYIGIAISAAMYNYRAYRFATMVRGALVTAVYAKTMELSISALDESAAITLMSTDVQRISEAMALVHELWACPIDIGIAIWLLEAEIGLGLLGPVAVSILAVSLVATIASRMASAQKQWLEKIQTRVSITAKALQTMKGVKMMGMTSILSDIIEGLRKTEIAMSIDSRKLMAYGITCGNITDIFAPGTAFIIFVIIAKRNDQLLTASSAFTTLSLISLLATPVKLLINFAIPQLMVAVGCFDRIQDYLLSKSRRDDRLAINTACQEGQTELRQLSLDNEGSNLDKVELETLLRKTDQVAATGIDLPSIRVMNCTLTWNHGDHPVINNVSFEISKGLTMLVGPVGSGKSSMIKGLLGEIESTKGHVYMNSLQVAFVDQSPWIHHGTLQENIVGMSTVDNRFYSKVIHACALDEDFNNLSHGDKTPVGSAGTGLSGGQKLRVALARAVYSRKSILILDDVFSGLDASSEDRIFSRLLGKQGLLQDLGTTTLLATHAVHRLSYADHILALDSDGAVCERGSFLELIKSDGYVSHLATIGHKSEAGGKAGELANPTSDAQSEDSETAVAASDVNRPVGDLRVYQYYFASTGYGSAAIFLALMVIFAFFLQFPALWLTFWTDAVAARGNIVNGKYLGGLIAFEVVAMVSLACVVFHTYLNMVPRSALRLHGRLLSTIRNAPLHFFTSTNIGSVLNKFSQDMNVVDFELPSALVEFTGAFLVALLQAVLICLSAAYFAAIMPAVLGIMYLLQKFYLRTSRQIRLIDLEAKTPLYSNFLESLTGLVTIRAFGWTRNFEQRNLILLDNSQRPFYMFFCIQRWLNLVLDLTVAGLAVLLMVLIVTFRDSLKAGLVGVALLNIMNFNLSLTEVIKQWTTLETSLGAISRVKNFVQDTPSEHLPREGDLIPEQWSSRGRIMLDHVSASYTTEGPLVLKDVNLSINSGEKVGIVGSSGSGKSSLVSTLLHLLTIRNGAITIDGVDISTISREGLRQHINTIPQEPLFFTGTIRENLDPFSRATSEQDLTNSLKMVDLWATISSAGGLDAPLQPEKLLSHGQRQLFCLARAIVNRSQSRILVLDEATASVDFKTDEKMQRVIREQFKEYTIIAVAHRLGTVVDFGRILVLDQGQIIEDGAPNKLLADEKSSLKKLWDSRAM